MPQFTHPITLPEEILTAHVTKLRRAIDSLNRADDAAERDASFVSLTLRVAALGEALGIEQVTILRRSSSGALETETLLPEPLPEPAEVPVSQPDGQTPQPAGRPNRERHTEAAA